MENLWCTLGLIDFANVMIPFINNQKSVELQWQYTVGLKVILVKSLL